MVRVVFGPTCWWLSNDAVPNAAACLGRLEGKVGWLCVYPLSFLSSIIFLDAHIDLERVARLADSPDTSGLTVGYLPRL